MATTKRDWEDSFTTVQVFLQQDISWNMQNAALECPNPLKWQLVVFCIILARPTAAKGKQKTAPLPVIGNINALNPHSTD